MFDKIIKFFSKKNPPASPEFDEVMAQQWYDQKTALMVDRLGPEHDMVMHAIIPYAAGGGLDLYYFPNGVEGLGIATKELSENPEEGSANDVFELYELVMFTRHAMDLEQAKNEQTPFGQAHTNINSVLNVIAQYSAQATLNPNETCEFPKEMEKIGGKCFLFDAYPSETAKEKSALFGVMVVIEVFRSEMDAAREHGGAQLIQKLKDAGHYPYSDLDRDPVV
ncbi:suppressor of fused domain protein [Verrucomicrobiaceae bacterium 5K15]|uniref:Suppressor of fused domain protein n=1 Tax=Oceaniferula flava TaxID=2800421 RepID=A0AAE2SBK1_9BACT|nr:suppressor of fused domain protein [Oceaniferula flavus]MBK1853914.1 suppressor of fused domain protein [Oceaniferula flavus]MBM1135220.1 suppressor of fused domain protein [Oceaniferula flavus]